MRTKLLYFLVTGLLAYSGIFVLTGCTTDSSGNGGGDVGIGGSMARFVISGDCLYTVDKTTMRIFDISNAAKPAYLPGKNQNISGSVETIFPMDTLLFIGTRNGMYIYNVKNPQLPEQLSYVSHITSCDPVVAKDNYAYVTLNSENSSCGRNTNLLLVFDITDLAEPEQVSLYHNLAMPRGLGIDGDRLFVCDNGIKVFSLEDPAKPKWVNDLSGSSLVNIDAYDIIPLAGHLMVIGQDGLYQYTYRNDRFSLLSRILVSRSSNINDYE